MIPLLHLMLLSRPAAPSTPLWADELLRHAPTRMASARRDPPKVPNAAPAPPLVEGFVERRTGPFDPMDKILRDEQYAFAKRVARLIEASRYEEAYRVADVRRLDKGLEGWGYWLAYASLLTGRFSEVEDQLTDYLRQHPEVEGHNYNSPELYRQLSLAVAMQGRVYPGQGQYVLDPVRARTTPFSEQARYVATIPVPTTPRDVAFMSVLALSGTDGFGGETAYLEWALRLEPRCVLAAEPLVDHYQRVHRNADAARVAASMVEALHAGAARDGFAKRLREAQQAMGAKPAASTNTNG